MISLGYKMSRHSCPFLCFTKLDRTSWTYSRFIESLCELIPFCMVFLFDGFPVQPARAQIFSLKMVSDIKKCTRLLTESTRKIVHKSTASMEAETLTNR